MSLLAVRRSIARPGRAPGALVWHVALVCAMLGIFVVAGMSGMSTQSLSIGGCLVWSALIVFVYRVDVTNVFVLFSIPWVLILVSTTLPISGYTRPVDARTVMVVLACACTVLALTPPLGSTTGNTQRAGANREQTRFDRRRFAVFGWILVALTLLNVVFAGFIPLTSLLLTGNSRYMEFGLPGFYGFYNAFANAFGVMAFYLFLATRRRRYLAVVVGCLLIFLCFFSRQNAVSLAFECFVVQCLAGKRPSAKKVLVFLAVVATLFSLAGNARIGEQSIYELAAVDDAYRWLPEPVVWLYSYSYFNILNIDNLIRSDVASLWNGSSVLTLLPSFLRPASQLNFETIEAIQFNVTSFIDPVYRDVGSFGLVVVLAVICVATQRFRRQVACGPATFFSLASFSVLAFCFLFSFFVNFWFYLPIIAQLLFFKIFSVTVFRRLPYDAHRGRPVPPRVPKQAV